jgi:acyl-[acyl-carrier-protein]-phospholipid O-acyltransferase / long-chain-fatty-acid--[acyl-carrier-protein] ligase
MDNVMLSLLRALLRTLFRVRVRGAVHASGDGGRLFVANCDSVLDSMFLALFLPGDPLVAITPEMRAHPISNWLLRFIPHCMPESSNPYAIKEIVRTVRGGKRAVIFPQGRVTTTGGLMKTHDSAGSIAARCEAALVPVRIEGTLYSHFSLVSQRWPKRWFPQVTLTMLQPVTFTRSENSSPRKRRARNAAQVLHVMQRSMAARLTDETLFDAYISAVSRFGRSARIIEDVRQQPETYGKLLRTTLALGRVAARITRRGETVGVLMPNLSVSVALIMGLSANDRVVAILNYSSGAEAMRLSCCAARLETLITSRAFLHAAKLHDVVSSLSDVRIVYIEDLGASITLLDKLWLMAFAIWCPRLATQRANPAAPAVVLFTSGSEGRPKGVAQSHDGMLSGMAQLRAVIDFGPDDHYFNALPLYHIYGLVACTLMPLMYGTPLFLYISPLRYRAIPELVYQKQCTYVFGTSTFLGHYARHAHPYDFSSVRVVISGGEKLNRDVAELWLKKFGLRIYEGYGATECGPAMTLNTPIEYEPGTVGRVLPWLDYQIKTIPGIKQGGVLHVSSPNLMLGYYSAAEPGVLIRPGFDSGARWHNTGDVVSVDTEGFVSILGRVKRFAKVAGEMVSLDMIERIALHASPAYAHAATLAQQSGGGEITVLFTTDPELNRAALHNAAHALELHELAVARRVVHIESLPFTGNGKTDYIALRLEAENKSPAATSNGSAR